MMKSNEIQSIIERFEDEDESLVTVKTSSWEDEGKYSNRETIVQDSETKKYYSIYETRSGSYYEYFDPVVFEVEPHQETTTVWKVKK